MTRLDLLRQIDAELNALERSAMVTRIELLKEIEAIIAKTEEEAMANPFDHTRPTAAMEILADHLAGREILHPYHGRGAFRGLVQQPGLEGLFGLVEFAGGKMLYLRQAALEALKPCPSRAAVSAKDRKRSRRPL